MTVHMSLVANLGVFLLLTGIVFSYIAGLPLSIKFFNSHLSLISRVLGSCYL